MKAFEALKEIVGLGCFLKGKKFSDFEVLEGTLNPRATYYYTFKTRNVPHYSPDVILLPPSGEKMYLYKIEH